MAAVTQPRAAVADPGDRRDAAPVLERADDAEALMTAHLTGERVRIADMTTETSEAFALPSGEIEATVSAGVVRMRRDGAWVPVDLDLRQAPDGTVAPVSHPAGLSLSGERTAATTELASVGTGAGRISMGWRGALPAPVLVDNRATYPDVLPDVDLVVEATRTGFEQFVVLKSPAAVSRVGELSLPLAGGGMSAVEESPDGTLDVTDRAGRPLATVPTPLMWDARVSADGESPARTAQVDLEAGAVRPVAAQARRSAGLSGVPASAAVGQVALTLSPDEAWLRDPATRFPVTIDPQINKLLTTFDTFVKEGVTADSGAANDLQLGVTSEDKPRRARSFVKWDTTDLRHKQITSARTYFYNWYSTTCAAKSWEIWTTEAADADTRWANQPKWLRKEGTSTETKGFDSSCGDGWVSIDAKNFFQYAADTNQTRADMGIRATNEADKKQWKQFRSRNADNTAQVPYAKVTYTEPLVNPPGGTCFEEGDPKWAAFRAEMENMVESGELTRARADGYKCDPRIAQDELGKAVEDLAKQPQTVTQLPPSDQFTEVDDPDGEEVDDGTVSASGAKPKKPKKKCVSGIFLTHKMGWPAELTAKQSINFCWNGKKVSDWSGECAGSVNKAARLLYWSFDSCSQNDWIPYTLGGKVQGGIHHKTQMKFVNKTPWTFDVDTTIEQWGHYDGSIDRMVNGRLLGR